MEKKLDFEEKMQRLENVVEALSASSVPLKESIKLYEEGSQLIKELNKELSSAEKKVKILTENNELEDYE